MRKRRDAMRDLVDTRLFVIHSTSFSCETSNDEEYYIIDATPLRKRSRIE